MRLRPGRLVLGAVCCAAAAATAPIAHADAPAATLSMGPSTGSSAPAPSAPDPSAVALTALPAAPTVGRPVRVTVVDPPVGAHDFAWDVNGRGVHPGRTGARPYAEVAFASPGAHVVAVRFSAGAHTRLGVLTLTVAPASALARARRTVPLGRDARVTAHAAGDPPVAIADFHFSPATMSIHVGDTVTWTNTGPSSHTATGRNGGFETGVLKKGQSASHTFTRPGTFTYFCQIHPFMHGAIVVRAATTKAGSPAAATTPAATTAAATPTATAATATPTATAAAATPAATAATATPAATAAAGPTLPNTGFNVLGGLLAGLLLVGLGAALRQTQSR